MPDPAQVLSLVEAAGRTCYKSEHLISSDSAADFVGRIVASGHHSVIEHGNITVRFVCDRGVTHELVRHRLAAYSQESTRYANYSQERFGSEITVIKPMFWEEGSEPYQQWEKAMLAAEAAYLELLAAGAKPQEARAVLPNSLKTEIVMTANLREWRHVLGLRSSKAAHPQIRQIMLPLMADLARRLPPFFADLAEKYAADIEEFASGPAALGSPQ
ncbi:MAG: FAD-dependent thymidylate synthase [Desulfarculaceae bacterium]|nr:FAD-dependent thymidylate synthase [Desulfarculaceae bacterium]MCF8071456.1 FAD-dependent thymidylate synthase [Desulfarculaceae bacterium]MCF8103416.1 FAD-dependent thymidylate synthase [Desulfarculaceae bacterium]MCF8118178.1 FAD-dependent thymidylate synthase [Desulfarculaceae bacterium]